MSTNTLDQCINCAQLRNGIARIYPCRHPDGHKFEPLSRHAIAKALGSAGGRPKVYATEAERIAARRETFRRSNDRRRANSAAAKSRKPVG